MSEPKCISPLLDGFAIGKLMSSHNGVRCYPALKENSDNKYIVKIISVPASQVQLDALLLTGAYTDPAYGLFQRTVQRRNQRSADTQETIQTGRISAL